MRNDIKKIITVIEAQVSAVEASIVKDGRLKEELRKKLTDIDIQFKDSCRAIEGSQDVNTIKLELKWQSLGKDVQRSITTSLRELEKKLRFEQEELASLYVKLDIIRNQSRKLHKQASFKIDDASDDARLLAWRLIPNQI